MRDSDTLKRYAYDTAVSVSPEVTPTHVLGRLARADSKTGQVGFSYDAFGRVNARTFTDNQGARYVEKSLYNYDGSPAALEFRLPDHSYKPEVVNYSYDSAGRLRAMNADDSSGSQALYRAEHIDALGRLRSARYGGSTIYKADYADQGRRLLRRSEVRSPQGHREASFSEYDVLGRELLRREVRNGVAGETRTGVAYDALGRLAVAIQMKGATPLFAWKYSYDALGNVVRLDDMLGAADASLSYADPDPDRVCRVGYGNRVPRGSDCNVGYDALGNVVSQPTRMGQRQLTYYSSGAVRTITEQGAQARFAYDAFGQVQEMDVQGGTTQDKRRDRRYGALIERREVTSGNTTSSMIVRYIPAPGGSTVSRRGWGDEWVFGFGELRGNRHFTDQNGAFVQDVDYSPFGEAVSTGLSAGAAKHTNYLWNGGDALAAFGLSHLGARVYDPVIGRFLSRDPLLIARGAATTNPYAFAMNDPLNAADPSGLDCTGAECRAQNPLVPPVWKLPGSVWSWFNGGGGDTEQVAPPVSSGPQTRAGKGIKLLTEISDIGSFGNNFDFDALARHSNNWEEALNILRQTKEASDAIAAHNATLDAVGSVSAGFGDALLCKNFALCGGLQVRAGLGITSGDANDFLYKAGHTAGIAISPDPESAVSAVPSLAEGIVSEVYPEGSFFIFDWSGHPLSEVLRPEGPFRLRDKADKKPRRAAKTANDAISRRYGLAGKNVDIHEIHPVKFGGDPTDMNNKVVLPREIHRKYVTPWWNRLQRDLERKR